MIILGICAKLFILFIFFWIFIFIIILKESMDFVTDNLNFIDYL
jgi:hypothetical protein